MPNSAFAKDALELEQLVNALARHAEELPDLQAGREELAAAIEQAKVLHSRQQGLTARLRVTTQDLHRTVRDAKDLAARLRSGVKHRYGIHSDQLREFGSRPRKRRAGPRSAPPGAVRPTPRDPLRRGPAGARARRGDLPARGRPLPQLGKLFPSEGAPFPSRGENAPLTGERFPPEGRNLPLRGEVLPPEGEYLPLLGE
jgi:hypothetical protein